MHDASTPRTARVRYRLPWSWSSFDYRELCRALWAQSGDARFETAKVEGRVRAAPTATSPSSPTAATLRAAARRRRAGLAARPRRRARTSSRPTRRSRAGSRCTRTDAGGDALDVWVERDLVRRGYGWRVPAGGEARIGVGSYEPRHHVRRRRRRSPARLGASAVALPGQLVPAPPARRDRGRRVLRGRQRRAVLPPLGRGHPHGVLLRDRLRARAARACSPATPTATEALARYAAFHDAHAPRVPAVRCACSGCCRRCRRAC